MFIQRIDILNYAILTAVQMFETLKMPDLDIYERYFLLSPINFYIQK